MKPYYIIILLLVASYYGHAQVGIGTTNPNASSILHLESTSKGILVPQLTTAMQNSIEIPAEGLLIYNTDEKALKINTGTKDDPNWLRLKTTNPSVKYSNTNTSDNVYTNSLQKIPILGKKEWNDNDLLYQVDLGEDEIRVTQSGTYRIIVNVSLIDGTIIDIKNLSAIMQIAVNGTATGTYASTAFIKREDGHETTSLHFNELLELDANNVLSVKMQYSASGGIAIGAMRLRSEGSSTIYIEKL